MLIRVEIFIQPGHIDPQAESIKKIFASLGYKQAGVEFRRIYFLEGSISKQEAESIAKQVLVDPFNEGFKVFYSFLGRKPGPCEIEIVYNPGVTDPVSQSVKSAAADMLGRNAVSFARTGRRIKVSGIKEKEFSDIEKFLFNPLIEHKVSYSKYSRLKTLDEFSGKNYEFKLIKVNLLDAEDADLERIGKEGLSLNLAEMKTIREYFRKLGRSPTDCELETLAQTWSEHCVHKTFRGNLHYREKDSRGNLLKEEKITNLLKNTIAKVTNELNSDYCVSVFEDNSGIIKFNSQYNVCFKVETHNHPSALEPFGGASTGIGGVIRDILGTGKGAYPIASTDIFCFAQPNTPAVEGVLAPARIIKGVVEGVKDYGNKMGIPTVNGAVLFDQRFLGNPLVFCGNIGLIPKDKCFKEISPGQVIIVAGGKTGKDGIHGATFSSAELHTKSTEVSSSAVQIGSPIEEKKLASAIIKARDKNLYSAITDCGAGGLSSAAGEISQKWGCKVDLEKVPLKYQGLSYTEIWISESQERMVIVADKKNLPALDKIFQEEEVNYAVIGEITDTKKLELFYQGENVCSLDMNFLYNGLPKIEKKAVWVKPEIIKRQIPAPSDYNLIIKKLLSSYNICSKEWIIRQYDHEVQAGTFIKPLMGENFGPADAAVIKPVFSKKELLAISCGINPFYSDCDPYFMAGLVIDEALRNITAAGGNINHTAMLDNFCLGSAEDEKVLGDLVRTAKGCYDFARAYKVPFISGKDSFYNEFKISGERIVIPATLLISALSVLPDKESCMSCVFKKEKNLLYVLGRTGEEMGGSEYLRISGNINADNRLPQVFPERARRLYEKVYSSARQKIIESCHDCSDGGLAVALAEMCLGSNLGADIFTAEIPFSGEKRDDYVLFSETPSRFVAEVSLENREKFEQEFAGFDYGIIGCVSEKPGLRIYGLNSKIIADLSGEELDFYWRKTFSNW